MYNFQVPPIDKTAGGQQIEKLRGHIKFDDVSFTYPMRKDVTVDGTVLFI